MVSKNSVGIAGLRVILQEVTSLGIDEEERLRAEFLRRVKVSHYIPASAETAYAESLYKSIDVLSAKRWRRNRGLTVRILGLGSLRCERLTAEAMSALAELQLAADVGHVKHLVKIAQ